MISIQQNPVGETYRKLIEYASRRSSQFVLVLDSNCTEFKESCSKILEQLKPYLIKKIKHNSWPGTISLGCCAIIYHFQCNRHTVSILQNTANSLYEWLSPKLPMDLSFIDKNNYEWLVSVTHEKISWLNICDQERKDILEYVPNLQLEENKSKTLEQLLQDKDRKFLSLNHKHLYTLPEEIADFKNLEVLLVKDDTINELPEFIGNLHNLKRLDISGIKITSIPPSIFHLPDLKELRIENTMVSVIPKDIGNLKNLTILELNNNKITVFTEPVIKSL